MRFLSLGIMLKLFYITVCLFRGMRIFCKIKVVEGEREVLTRPLASLSQRETGTRYPFSPWEKDRMSSAKPHE